MKTIQIAIIQVATFIQLSACATTNKLEVERKKTFLEVLSDLERNEINASSIVFMYPANDNESLEFHVSTAQDILSLRGEQEFHREKILRDDSTLSSPGTNLIYYSYPFFDSSNIYLGKIMVSFYGSETQKIANIFSFSEASTTLNPIDTSECTDYYIDGVLHRGRGDIGGIDTNTLKEISQDIQ